MNYEFQDKWNIDLKKGIFKKGDFHGFFRFFASKIGYR